MSQVVDRKVAKRYANALFQTARQTGASDAVQRDLASLEALWSQVPALRHALESPLVPGERKHEIVDKAFAADLEALSKSFLHLLIEKRRENILSEVSEEFNRQADVERGLIRAEAIVAAPLDQAQESALVEGLKKRTGKQIELTVNVEPDILGGAIVRMQDTVIDGSVRGALERLREQMLHPR